MWEDLKYSDPLYNSSRVEDGIKGNQRRHARKKDRSGGA
jgi:hypothetical protein